MFRYSCKLLHGTLCVAKEMSPLFWGGEGGVFYEAVANSVLLYGADVWRCCGSGNLKHKNDQS